MNQRQRRKKMKEQSGNKEKKLLILQKTRMAMVGRREEEKKIKKKEREREFSEEQHPDLTRKYKEITGENREWIVLFKDLFKLLFILNILIFLF